MKLSILCSLFFLVSCLTAKERPVNERPQTGPNLDASSATATVSRLEQPGTTDANRLKFSLKAEVTQWGPAGGALLSPELDDAGNYISYTACTFNVVPKTCVSGQLPAIRPEIRWDFPNAHVMIRYRACVVPERALRGEECSSEKIANYPPLNVTPPQNDPTIQQLLDRYQDLSLKIRELAFEVRTALRDFNQARNQGADENEQKLNELANNQLAMDPYTIGSFYDSSVMDKYLEATQTPPEAVSADKSHAKTYAKYRYAIALLNFGTNTFIEEAWPEYIGLVLESSAQEKSVRAPIKPSRAVLPSYKRAQPIVMPPAYSSRGFGVYLPTQVGRIMGSYAAKKVFNPSFKSALIGIGIEAVLVVAASFLTEQETHLALAGDAKTTLFTRLNEIGTTLAKLKTQQTQVKTQLDSLLGATDA